MNLSSLLNERVRIERPVTVDDEFGGKQVTWGEVATVFAQVKPVFGAVAERVIGQQRQAEAGYRVTMRYREDVTAAMRLIWKNHILLVHSLHENEGTLQMLTYEEHV